uniref:Chitin-binding type-2 domain-containing protein n=1 Tax=Anopheles epiroticus TaxID=199890 RepID=A0A182PID4_9DIPT
MHTAAAIPLLLLGLGAIQSLLACEHASRASAPHWLTVVPNHWMCSAPNSFDIFPHETDCARYYECVCNDAYEYACAPGLRFNTRKLRCENSPLCSGGAAPEESSPGMEPPVGPMDPRCPSLESVKVWTDEHNCAKYYQCARGQVLELHCPETLVYDSALKRCTLPNPDKCCAPVPAAPTLQEELDETEAEEQEEEEAEYGAEEHESFWDRIQSWMG